MTVIEFKERFISIYPKLFAIAMMHIGNSEDAKDVMQLLYMKLWNTRSGLTNIENEIGYCRTLLVNLCRDRWRAKSLEPEFTTDYIDVPCGDNTEFEFDDLKEKIEHFISRLPEKQRRIMVMRMQGATTEEIIEATGLSVENVRTILSRTRVLIREYYKMISG